MAGAQHSAPVQGSLCQTKRCTGCERELPIERFAKAYKRVGPKHDGLRTRCRECEAARQREWYARNPEQSRKQVQRARDSGWKYLYAHRARRVAAGLHPKGDWDQRLRCAVNAAARKGREYWPMGCRVTPTKLVPQKPEPKPWHGLKGAEKHRVRWQHDPKYRLYHRLKRWMQKHLRDGAASAKWSEYLGYQPQELAQHLERQFVRGMGWHNMGEWHIDHIVPVAAFDFERPTDPDFRACYSLANLRPIWARDNLAKGDTRTHLI